MSFSKAVVSGRLLGGVELRHTNDNQSVSHFDLQSSGGAVLRCNCWGGMADASQKLKDGDVVFVTGTLIIHSQKPETAGAYASKTFQINAKEIQLLHGDFESISSGNLQSDNNSSNSKQQGSSSNSNEDISDVFGGDEIPF